MVLTGALGSVLRAPTPGGLSPSLFGWVGDCCGVPVRRAGLFWCRHISVGVVFRQVWLSRNKAFYSSTPFFNSAVHAPNYTPSAASTPLLNQGSPVSDSEKSEMQVSRLPLWGTLRRNSGTFRNFRNHSIEQGFGGSGSMLNCPHRAKLPSLLANYTDAPCH
jgi:hypothetical protein